MQVKKNPSILVLSGRGQDERVWGSFLPRLRRGHDVVLLEDARELTDSTDLVVLASWEQMSRPAAYEDELAALNVPVLVSGAGGDPYAAAIARALAERAT